MQTNIMSKIIGINLFTIGVSATLIDVWKEGGFDMYLTALDLLCGCYATVCCMIHRNAGRNFK